MILLKTKEEIEKLRASNQLVSKTLGELAKTIGPGVTTRTLDKLAEDYIRDHGGIPGFLGYNGFPATLCTSLNDEVVHGIPSEYTLREGDILSVDCGVKLNGYYGDSAYTFAIGDPEPEWKRLMITTRESLFRGIEIARAGNRLGDIAYAIQSHAENSGYSVVREMVGHGLGKNLHEEPEVPNFGKRGTGLKLRAGMVFCIEPMINLGTRYIQQDKDGWTIRTRDGQPSAHFELAIAVTEGEPDILSTFRYIEEVLK
jgi:methionyl aminopeptidase